ncbi:unnamed protein product, partial [Allacma fusca]
PSHKAYSQHGGAYQGFSGAQHGGAAAAKPTYPQLLQDNRQLNHDGTINFQYAADNGLQQGESVDPDGTRRGFYSYIGADGKPLTVKYTAGKNGFVAEGAHLPRQPNVAAPQTKDEVVARPHGGHGGHSGHGGGAPSAGAYYGGAPSHYSAAHQGGGHHQGARQYQASPAPSPYQSSPYNSRPNYNPPSPYYDADAGRQSFGGQYQSAPQTQYTQSLPSHGGQGQGRYQGFQGASSGFGGSMHSHVNPYTPAGPAGPYQGQFDLGNGGTFSINFEPGAAQEVAYGGASGAGQQQQQRQY